MRKQHDCSHLLGELSEYVDGELNGELCAELERHLASCEDCRIVVDTLKKTIYLVHATTESEAVPADVRERLYKCLDLNEFLDP
jgi:anti-sigma factor (TIGR02949 family)